LSSKLRICCLLNAARNVRRDAIHYAVDARKERLSGRRLHKGTLIIIFGVVRPVGWCARYEQQLQSLCLRSRRRRFEGLFCGLGQLPNLLLHHLWSAWVSEVGILRHRFSPFRRPPECVGSLLWVHRMDHIPGCGLLPTSGIPDRRHLLGW